MDRDKNLLFGVFAVQLGKITAQQLASAAGAWATDPSSNLGDKLVEDGVLTQPDKDLIANFVDQAVQAHNNDPAATLTAFGGQEKIHQSFAGTIIATDSGGIDTAPGGAPKFSRSDARERDLGVLDDDEIPGVTETPGRYTLRSEYARGGMGRVLLVHDVHLGRDVALKELLPEIAGSGSGSDKGTPVRKSMPMIARFLQEAKITGQLEHPSIVPVYELGTRTDGSIYYTMKLVRGKTLSQAIRDAANLQERLGLLSHFVDLCNAIAYSHSRGVIHRDLKPGNVMVGEFGETVVLDWGLAKAKDQIDQHADGYAETIRVMNMGDEAAYAKTQFGHALGTPVYMPPEQAAGDLDHIDERSDVYSLGAILYELLTSTVPFEGDSLKDIIDQVLKQEPRPIKHFAADAPEELIAIATKAMAKDPNNRYDSAKSLAQDIERFQSGALVQAHSYTPRDYLRIVWRQYRVQISAAALVVVSLIAFSGLYTYSAVQSQARERELREQAQAERDEARRQLYISSIFQAGANIESGRYDLARSALHQAPVHLSGWEWGYHYNQSYPELFVFTGHTGNVSSAVFSPDGKRILTESWDNTARLWDAETGEALAILKGHSDSLRSAVFSPDGARIATVSKDNTARLWEVETGETLSILEGHTGPVTTALFSPDGARILTASSDRTARLWELETGETLNILEGHTGPVTTALFSPDGARILTASSDRTARLWDRKTGETLSILDGHTGAVESAVFSPDGTLVLTKSRDYTIRLWDTETGEALAILQGHISHINSAVFSPDCSSVLTASSDGTARLWDAETGAALHALKGHSSSVNSAVFSPDGTRILTASNDQTARLWDAEPGEALAVLKGHKDRVSSAVFSPDGARILTASYDGTARLWAAETSADPLTDKGHSPAVYTTQLSPNGARVLALSDEGAFLFDADTEEFLGILNAQMGKVSSAVFSPDSSMILTASRNGTTRLWDAETGATLRTLEGHSSSVNSAVFSPDGARILTASSDGTARLWHAETGETLAIFEGHTAVVKSAVFSPDGTRILTASVDHTARLWDAETGETRFTLERPFAVNSAVFSPDGARILTASSDMTALLWDAESGKTLGILDEHTEDVASAAFSPDGARILITSADGTARLWDAETGETLSILEGHTGAVVSAVFSPDGTRILTTFSDNTWQIRDAAPWQLDDPRLAPALANLELESNLIDEEKRRLALHEWKRLEYVKWVKENVSANQN